MSSTSLFKWMGIGTTTKQPHEVSQTDEGERYFGLENFGNTCYCNSVIQALYYCKPFRECLTNFPNSISTTVSLNNSNSNLSNGYHNNSSNNNLNGFAIAPSSPGFSKSYNIPACSPSTSNRTNSQAQSPSMSTKSLPRSGLERLPGTNLSPGMEDTLFAALKDLFWEISTHRKKTGVVAPVNFINKVKKENELFRSSMHQDAHEFLNYLLNTIAEDVQKYQKKTMNENGDRPESNNTNSNNTNGQGSIHTSNSDSTDTNTDSDSSCSNPQSTWVHQLFEGVFSNETKCLTCETVTSRDESFMDLSIDVEMNSSVTSCLRQFSASETLCHKNKYFCDECCGLQEAERRMKIKKLPNILALHLKRFKYQEQLQKYIKLTYRVVFPFELRLFNTCDDTEDADRLYELWACVIHIGSGPHHGHYVTIIKSNGQWMLFDDDEVTNIQEEDIQKYFSDLPGSGSGYVLFYQAVNLTMDSLNMANGSDMNCMATKIDDMKNIYNHHQSNQLNHQLNHSIHHNNSSRLNGNDIPILSSPSLHKNNVSSPAIGNLSPGLDATDNHYFQPSISADPHPNLNRRLDSNDHRMSNGRASLPPATPTRTRTWGLGRKIREKKEKR